MLSSFFWLGACNNMDNCWFSSLKNETWLALFCQKMKRGVNSFTKLTRTLTHVFVYIFFLFGDERGMRNGIKLNIIYLFIYLYLFYSVKQICYVF